MNFIFNPWVLVLCFVRGNHTRYDQLSKIWPGNRILAYEDDAVVCSQRGERQPLLFNNVSCLSCNIWKDGRFQTAAISPSMLLHHVMSYVVLKRGSKHTITVYYDKQSLLNSTTIDLKEYFVTLMLFCQHHLWLISYYHFDLRIRRKTERSVFPPHS